MSMKKALFYAGAIAFAAALAACGKVDEDNSRETAGNVTWAAANVDGNREFAARPDMNTKFYQWNRETAWAAEGSVSGWSSTADRSSTWTANPCPDGWRLPTRAEFEALSNLGSSWAAVDDTTQTGAKRGNAVAGRFFGVNHATCTMGSLEVDSCIFLPAAGCRRSSDGALFFLPGKSGSYWSSRQNDMNNGYGLYFDKDVVYTSSLGNKALGMNIRCVK